MMLAITKAQIIAINPKGVVVGPLEGPHKDKAFQGLPVRPGDAEGNFVDVVIHANGIRVDWPPF